MEHSNDATYKGKCEEFDGQCPLVDPLYAREGESIDNPKTQPRVEMATRIW